jgi:hypothetical protein
VSDEIEMSSAMQAREQLEAKQAPAKTKAKPATEEVSNAVEPAAETPVEAPESAETEVEASDAPETPEGAENAAETPEADNEETDARPKKRGKSAEQRIDELTKARREAERRVEEERAQRLALEQRIAALEGGTKPAAVAEPTAPKVDDPKYEGFGVAHPLYEQDYNQYLADLVDHRVAQKLEADKQKSAETSAKDAQEREQKAQADALNAAWNEKAAKAVEKYPDFNEVVVESAKNGEWDLLPLSAAAVQGSDVGDDIAYHLATHPEEAKKLAEAERGYHNAVNAALQAGLNPQVAHMMAAPYLMRGKDIFDGIESTVKGSSPAKKQANHTTNAPEPPSERVRGAGGQFSPDFTRLDCDLASLAKAIQG